MISTTKQRWWQGELPLCVGDELELMDARTNDDWWLCRSPIRDSFGCPPIAPSPPLVPSMVGVVPSMVGGVPSMVGVVPSPACGHCLPPTRREAHTWLNRTQVCTRGCHVNERARLPQDTALRLPGHKKWVSRGANMPSPYFEGAVDLSGPCWPPNSRVLCGFWAEQ